MQAKVQSCTVFGLEGVLVEVTVDITNGAAAFSVSGLPESIQQALQERICAAMQQSQYLFPSQHITIDILPSAVCQGRQGYHLPIAIGVLLASGQLKPAGPLHECLFLAELSSEGSILHTRGLLPMLALAREKQYKAVFVSESDAREAALMPGVTIFPVKTLGELLAHLSGERPLKAYPSAPRLSFHLEGVPSAHDMALVRGQEHVKRALEVAASGRHHTVLWGAPGSGRKFLAGVTPSIFPSMTYEEALVVTKIYSLSDLLSVEFPWVRQRPFRSPPLAIGQEELSGSAKRCRPGESSLAHQGVLFLDELPEYGQAVQEALHQAIERREVSISQAGKTSSYPAHFLLIASMRPCPCGFYMDPLHECTCSPAMIVRYHKGISRQLLAHLDLSIEVPRIDHEQLTIKRQVEHSQTIRARVQAAQERQRQRFVGTELTCNAEMRPTEISDYCQLEPAAEKLFQAAMQQLQLSAHASHSVLKLARTIADLAGNDLIAAKDLAEALQYRPRMGIEPAEPRDR